MILATLVDVPVVGKFVFYFEKDIDDGCYLWTQGTLESSWCRTKTLQRSIRDILTDLKVCGRTKNLQRGKEVHVEGVESGYDSCIFVATALVSMYAKCGSMADARQAFDKITHPDVVSWSALVLGYAENGQASVALDLFSKMKTQGCVPDNFAFVAALKACTTLALEKNGAEKMEYLTVGRQIHREVGPISDVYVQSTLIDMYAKCGSMLEARLVFDDMEQPNVVSWTALIMGYAENGEGSLALDLFAKMKSEGCAPNSVTFVAVLKACTSLAVDQGEYGISQALQRGKNIHSEFVYLSDDIYVQSTLIDMYAKCGVMTEARQVFDSMKNPNVVSWTALILGYAENGQCVTALDFFSRMRSRGCAPNRVTFAAALKACGMLGALDSGRKIHSEINCNSESDALLVTCLVDFYAKCGSLVEAQMVFDSHQSLRDMTTWTALLMGYSSIGDIEAVFRLFEGMQDAGFQPDMITFVCIFTCCSHAGLVEKANQLFETMWSHFGVVPTLDHYNCMLDIFGRSNKLDDAMALLRRMPCRPNAVTWKTLLASCWRWKNFCVGRMAFGSLVSLDDTEGAAYVLMALICRAKGLWVEHDMVLAMREKAGKYDAFVSSS